MDFIASFELSRLTLFGVFLAPFAFYGFHTKYWYSPERLAFFNTILTAICSGLCLVLGLKMYLAAVDHDTAQLQFALLHMCPLVLAILAVSFKKQPTTMTPAGHQRTDTSFTPRARNADVEELTWDQLVINESTKQELQSVITLLKDSRAAKSYGVKLPRGILLSGPPGTGKTTIAKVVANMAGLSFFVLRANEIVSKWVGESEQNLTKLFEAAQSQKPAIIFIDEIDSLGKKRSSSAAGQGDNLLNHLLQLIDGVLKNDGVYIIGATNRSDLVDEALKRAGRLNRVIEIPNPDLEARRKLFALYTKGLKLAPDINLDALADVTEGNSGADIKAITGQAALHAYQREQNVPVKLRTQVVTSEDLETALSEFAAPERDGIEFETQKVDEIQPLNDQIETLGWNDLIIDDAVREELQSVVNLLKDPETATRYGVVVPKGILLNGPPGTGKTTVAKVMANEAGLSFFALRLDEVISKWVGESEKNLTKLFRAAAKHAPSVIFIDEVDSVGKNRAEGNAQHADNFLNHLLQLVDGVIKREGIYIIAATNRADLVDPALKRGGRLNRVIELPLPGRDARRKIFELYLRKLPLASDVSFEGLADRTEGKSAADIKEICNQAGLNSYRRESQTGMRDYSVTSVDLENALDMWTRTSP